MVQSNFNKVQNGYKEKSEFEKTWSGFDVNDIYGPEDFPESMRAEIGDPGEYPFKRGIFRNMYKGKLWTKRIVTGMGTGKETNERIRFQIKEGISGLNTVVDTPTHLGLDADHPLAEGQIGTDGVNITTLKDMEELTEGVPLDKVSWSLVFCCDESPVLLPMYFVVAEQRGIPLDVLKGSVQNDPLHFRYCGYRANSPLGLSEKGAVDIIEYCTKYVPNWYTTTVNLYDLRENGLNAAQEIAYGISIMLEYIKGVLKRGLNIDDFAPRLAFYVASHIDFFEEIAKFRAARSVWAKILKEKFGAKKKESMQFRYAIHTAGCSLYAKQPLNNIIRVAFEAMAAVLGGAQSIHCCSYDEPIALPTERSSLLALRTQQILAYETGVTRVVDPLGGSYYVENLTSLLEKEIWKKLKEIEDQGGMIEAMRSQWLDRKIDEMALERQNAIETKEAIVVGVNEFVSEMETETPTGVQRIPEKISEDQIRAVKELKRTRNKQKLDKAIKGLKEKATLGEKQNLIPHIMKAIKAYASLQEIWGTVREVYGLPYDSLGVIESPFNN